MSFQTISNKVVTVLVHSSSCIVLVSLGDSMETGFVSFPDCSNKIVTPLCWHHVVGLQGATTKEFTK